MSGHMIEKWNRIRILQKMADKNNEKFDILID